jgi:hypothetical protein
MLSQPARKSACQFVYRELWVLFVGHRAIEAHFLARQPENPRSKKWPSMECGIHTCSIKSHVKNISAMLSQPARKSACQFVYRGTLGAICRTQSNRGPFLSPPAREPTIQKVAKYGMRDPYMLYKISCPYFIKVHI